MNLGFINNNIFRKRFNSLVLATVIASSSATCFSGCQNQDTNNYVSQHSESVGRQVIHFENEQKLYESILSIRNDLENFISNPYWQQQVVVIMSDKEEAELKEKIENTIKLFDEFIIAWEDNNSLQCTNKAKEIMQAYLDESNSPKYVSFKYLYEFIAKKSFPKGFTDIPREVKKDEPFQTYYAGKDTKIYYLGQDNTLIHAPVKISLDYIGDIDYILPFYRTIIINLTNTLLYVISEDERTIGVIKKDNLNEIIDNYLSRLNTLYQMDPDITTIYQKNDIEWDFFVDGQYVKPVPNVYYIDLGYISTIYDSIKNKKGSPFKIRIMLNELRKAEVLQEYEAKYSIRKSQYKNQKVIIDLLLYLKIIMYNKFTYELMRKKD